MNQIRKPYAAPVAELTMLYPSADVASSEAPWLFDGKLHWGVEAQTIQNTASITTTPYWWGNDELASS